MAPKARVALAEKATLGLARFVGLAKRAESRLAGGIRLTADRARLELSVGKCYCFIAPSVARPIAAPGLGVARLIVAQSTFGASLFSQPVY